MKPLTFIFCLLSLNTLADETNQYLKIKSVQKFSFVESLSRAQGIVFDNNNSVYFSGNYSLIKTNLKSLDKNIESNLSTTRYNDNEKTYIPELQKINHIGDIDLIEDKLIASLEDGDSYSTPTIALYNNKNLSLVGFVSLDANLHTDGVPWVATIPEKNVVLTSKYNNADEILIYDYKSIDLEKHTINKIGSYKLPHAINGIQGAKYFQEAIYISSNEKIENTYPVYKFDLNTQSLKIVAKLPEEVTEIEGLTFNEKEKEMFVLGITGKKLGRRINLYKFDLSK